jgi:diguanylate cyclase (GGDEF)-like protein
LSTDVGWEDLTAAHPELASAIENADDGAETDTWRHALQRERTSVRAGEVDARRDTVWLAVSCYRPDEGSIAVQLRDITEEVTQEERMRHDASHDAMTGLLNGAAFRTSLDRHLADGRPLVVFLLDLNGFKAVNDDMGHAAGDAVLQAVAKRLLHCTKDSDVVARLGGDEFVGLLSGDLAPGEIERLGQRIQSICSEAVTLPGGQQAKVSAAIGFARSFRDATSTELLAITDSEMYSDKRAGRDRRRPRTPHQL